jgi:uncharacterized protein YdaL
MRALAIVLLLLLAAAQAAAAPERLRVCLYFDGEDNAPGFRDGERSAVMVRNLLGHFAEVDVAMSPASRYVPGSASACDRVAYLGTFTNAALPVAFLSDVAKLERPVLWMNYNIWQLQERLGAERFRALWGFDYQRVEETAHPGDGGVPAFYSDFTYKGGTFRKPVMRGDGGRLVWDPALVIVANRSAEVLAEGIHGGNGARTPYVLRKGDRFYVADNPVSVIDERDRYLILADLLFDFLQLPPRTAKHYALARIEDVHPGYDLKLLYLTIEVFKRRKLPFAITLIPRYVGPGHAKGLEATESPAFVRMIQYAVANGASILVHGYEHQIQADLGCGTAFSGEGYEFWDACNRRALPFESEAFFQDRIDKAKKILHAAQIPYVGWVTPHYAASPLAMKVIERNFGRVLQQMRYYLDGTPDAANVIDQFYPYAIVRDHDGVHVWPENLGYVPLPSHGGSAATVDAMLAAARLQKKVRDGWASFFWHPPLIRTELGIASLERLVDGLRAEGYEFVSLAELRRRGE